jgi:diguanylate cyclase (GGDEF)-like protein
MFLDLDKFKQINDTYGHDAGDELLKAVAERLKACVRASDTVARLGGDEFTVLLPEAETIDEARIVGEKILEVMRQPVDLGPVSRVITTSIGISQFLTHAPDAVNLMKCADTAMYKVKGSGRAGMCIYSDDLAGESNRAEAMQEDLRQALGAARLHVELVPRLDVLTGGIGARSASMNWNDLHGETRDLEEIFDAASEPDLALSLLEFYLTAAIDADLAEPEPALPLHLPLPDSLLAHRQLAEAIRSCLNARPQWSGTLCLAVSEATLVAEVALLAGVMSSLDDHFVRLVVNEYGAARSHLDALSRVPLAGLGIADKLGKAAGQGDVRAQQRVRMILGLAELLGTRTLSARPLPLPRES